MGAGVGPATHRSSGLVAVRTRAGPGQVQLPLQLSLSGEEYVSQKAWQRATLECCPLHGTADWLWANGTYERATPPGARVARFWCERCRVSFSLLPDCLAARLPGTLGEVECAVAACEPDASGNPAPTQENVAAALRPESTLTAALRWLRRRLLPVRAALAAVRGLEPQRFAGCSPCLLDFRRVLNTDCVLVRLREIAEPRLASLPHPLGFTHRRFVRSTARCRSPHNLGTDPPHL